MVKHWSGLEDRQLCERWDEVKERLAKVIRSHEKSVRIEYREWVAEGKTDGVMRGFPLSVPPPNSPAHILSDHLEKEAQRRKMEYIKAKDSRGELPTRFFSAMVKQEEEERTIRAIRGQNGEIMTAQKDIAATMTAHFRALYTKRSATHELRPHCLALPPQVIRELEKEVTVTEGLEVVNSKSLSSAPGPDGLPYRVYTVVPGLMSLLMRVCRWVLVTGEVPLSWNIAYIRCLLKKGKEKLLPESYRLISLICTDCKIFTGVIASRLQQFGDIFGLDQTGYLRGRNTAMAALRVADCPA